MNQATLLDRILDGRDVDGDGLTEEVSALAALAAALSEMAEAEPVAMRPGARTAVRNDLLREANLRRSAPAPFLTRLRERISHTTDGWAYSARMAGISGLAAAILSGGGVATATGTSGPGDLFFGLKRAVEDVRLSFSEIGVSRGAQLQGRALVRISDASRAIGRGDDLDAAVALRLADGDARAGAQEFLRAYIDSGDTAVLTRLGDWVISAGAVLDELPPPGPEAADALADLRTSLNRIGQRIEVLATGACTSCALGVHDDAADGPDTARGTEADGTPPLPGIPVDLTFIPPADQPFQACPCVDPVGPGRSVAPPPAAPAPPAGAAPPEEEPAPPEEQPNPSGGGSGGGGGGGSGGGSGGGVLPVPVPLDPGPMPGPVTDPVRDAVEDVIEQLPDPGAAAPDL